jgi:integrase/recombinase XerD
MPFNEFLEDRQYLHNLSPRTIQDYQDVQRILGNPELTMPALNDLIISLRQRRLQASGVNCYIRGINAYLRWAGTGLKLQKLKEGFGVLPHCERGAIV